MRILIEVHTFIPAIIIRTLCGIINNLIFDSMKKQLLLLVLTLYCFSCSSQKEEVIAKSTIKLEGKNTNIRDLIEIDGYYTNPKEPQFGSIMFFEDGTWVYFHFKTDIPENEKNENMSNSVISWMEKNQLCWGSYWGVYKIEGDTIIHYLYSKASFWVGWTLVEKRYKVINRNAIKQIYYRNLLNYSDDYNMNNSPWIDGEIQIFTPADSLPSPNCWLKEEKWIWRNESDWKAYMERQKE